MIPYVRPTISKAAIRTVNQLLKAGQFAPAKYARQVENIHSEYGYHGVFVNSGTTANYLMVELLFERCGTVEVPPIAFATTYAPLVANRKALSFGEAEHGGFRVYNWRADAEAVLDCPVLGLPNRATIPPNAIFGADLCDCGMFGHLMYLGDRRPDAFTMSFHPAHIVNGGGGGAVYFKDAALAEKARKIVYWGRSCTQDVCTCSCEGCTGEKRYEYDLVGCNLQGSEINAAIVMDGETNWDLSKNVARLKNYSRLFEAAESNLHLIMYHPSYFSRSTPFAFPIRTNNKAALKAHLRKCGIEHRDLFTDGDSYGRKFGALRDGAKRPEHIERDRWLFIGCHENLTDEEINTMCKALRDFNPEVADE